MLLSQKNNCQYDFQEETDSTYLKITSKKLIYEKNFGNSKEFIQFGLMNNNGMPILEFQQIQKNTDFIPVKCLNNTSRLIFQLQNGKIISLLCVTKDVCSTLAYNEVEKANIRILSASFVFTKNNYEFLKSSPIILMKIQYLGESKDFVIENVIDSKILNETFYPSDFFIKNMHCIE